MSIKMRVLGILLCILIVTNVCFGKRNHDKHQRKNHHKKGDRHGNHHNGVNGKLDIHRADGCHCPKPDQVCVEGKATGGGPICVTAKFMKNGKRLLKEFNHHKSEGFKLKDKEPKPHHFQNHKIEFSKPHNVHIDVHSKPANHHSKHKKGRVHFEDTPALENQCTVDDMAEMRQRLAGWFRLIHAQDRESHPHRSHHGHHKHNKHLSVKKELRLHHHEGKCKCLKSVMWEFRHLDESKDHFLNQNELREIERNNMEPCLRPYLDSCDHNKDSRLSRNEWCCCFSDVLPPCYKELRNLREKLLTEDKDMILPKCDHEGFYAKEQCKGEHNKPRTCWCVDLNGNKVPHTESQHRAHCGHYNVLGLPKKHH